MSITKISAAMTDLDGAVTINESSGDADFRVESDSNTHAFYVDGGTSNVGIGESSPTGTALQIRRSGAAGIVLKETGVAQFYVEQDTDAKIRWTNSNDLIFSGGADGTTEKARILNGGGITFNGDTAAANALDDYEEGTWTPTIGTGTFSTSDAYYVKVGRFVKLSFRANTFSDNSTNTSIAIGGLPYPVESNQALGSVMDIQTDNTDADTSYANTSETLYFYSLSSGSWDAMTHADINNSSADFYVQGSYRTT